MKIAPFALERYFARYEFSAPYLLCSSDCESLTQKELLEMTDDETRLLWDNLRLGYTESQGHPLLRAEIAKLYRRISPADVLVLTPEEGIFIAMHTLLEPGDHVIATFPGYQSLYEIAKSIGCTVTQWRPNERYEFDTAELSGLMRENTKLLVINFPHNPTGATITQAQQDEIIALARARGIPVFSDEMYRFLEYDADARVEAICDRYEHGISLFGMSKTFGLAGLRIGWLATQDKGLCRRFAAYKDYTTICSSAPSEILAIIALRAKERIIARNNAIIAANLALLDGFFKRHDDFIWCRPKAGPIGFPMLKTGSAHAFCESLVAKKGVMLLPSSVYGYDREAFRIGFGRKNMPEALKLLEEYVDHQGLPNREK